MKEGYSERDEEVDLKVDPKNDDEKEIFGDLDSTTTKSIPTHYELEEFDDFYNDDDELM